MSKFIDEVSPSYVGQDLIGVTLDEQSKPAQALKILNVSFDYSRTSPNGVRVPIQVLVRPALDKTGVNVIRKIFRRVPPSGFSFRPVTAGKHLILVKEIGHNEWQGRLTIDVAGDEFSRVTTER